MRKLAIFVGGFSAATAVLIYLLGSTSLPLLAAASCVTGLLFLLPGKRLRVLAVFFLGVTLGTLWYTVYARVILRPADALCGTPAGFTARASEKSYYNGYRSRVAVQVSLSGRDVAATLYFDGETPVESGDVLMGTALFQPTATHIADGEDLYDISRGVYLVGTVEGELAVSSDAPLTLQHRLQKLSKRLQENLYAIFPADAAGYFTALTTGERSGMSYAFRKRLAVVGLYHAVSLSGMHVSILMSTLIFFCMGRKKLAAFVGIPVIILFCMLSGGSPATIRAVCMYIILLLGIFVNREYDPITALSAAMLLLLLENPWSLAHWGLQMSFASTVGILVLMPHLTQRLPKNRILRAVLTPMCVTISATVFSAPLMSVNFGMNSLVAPLTNLLALWSVTVSFVAGIFLSCLTFVSMPLAQLLALPGVLLYRWLELVTMWFSDLPFASVYSETPLLLGWSMVAYVLLVYLMICRPKWWLPAGTAAVTLALALLLTVQHPDGMTVLDVGHGQCILLHQGDGDILVDCGADGDTTGESAARFLISHGITSLDAVVITHFDADHCNGLPQLLDRVPAETVYYPKTEEAFQVQEQILSQTGSARLQPVTAAAEIALEQGQIRILPAVGGTKENDTGLSVLASVRECDILITGDLSEKAEARLIARYDLPDLEVFVAGHHGSKASTGKALLDALRPETVLISVGKNSYDLPARQSLERIEESGAEFYCTRTCGNLIIRW